MTIAFRVDSSAEIGCGHLMRCLALAEELRDRGEEIVFVTRRLAGSAIDLARANAFLTCELTGESHVGQEDDAQETVTALEAVGVSATAVVVDSYSIDARWEGVVRSSVPAVIVIDDNADRAHDCDVLLDHQLYEHVETRYVGLVPAGCRLLLGPKWALLGKEYVTRQRQVLRDGVVKRLLISYGGADPTHETEKALEALVGLDGPETIDVVLGAAFAERAARQDFVEKDRRLAFHVRPSGLSPLMLESDLALGAGGQTSLERCALGLPAVVTAVAQNQPEGLRVLARRGAALYLGPADRVTAEDLRSTLRRLLNDRVRVASMSRAAAAVIPDDYEGTSGVARAIIEVAHGKS